MLTDVAHIRRHLGLWISNKTDMMRTILVLFITTFVILLPIICRNHVYSWYFSTWLWTRQELTSLAMEQNAERLLYANNYINAQNQGKQTKFATNVTNIVIGVITVKRGDNELQTGYLTQTVAKLHQILNDPNMMFPGTDAFICNTFAGPGKHEEANNIVKVFKTYKRFPNESISHSILLPFVKERQDYLYCLELALSYNSTYVMLLEDDALPHRNILEILYYLLNEKVVHDDYWNRLGKSDSFAFLKLYYPERWQGFSTDFISAVEISGCGIFGGVLAVGYVIYCTRCRRRYLKTFIYGAVYIILLTMSVGRPHLMELRRLSKHLFVLRDSPKCCTPAHLYPTSSARILRLGLQEKVHDDNEPLDMLIDNILDKHNLPKYLVEPNLAQHIGLLSTLKGVSTRPEEFVFLQ